MGENMGKGPLHIGKLRIGVETSFSAAHYLPGHPKCGIIHGHNYKVRVELEGPEDAEMLVDFGIVKKHLNDILKDLDHEMLNKYFSMPTAEVLAKYIWEEMSKRFHDRKDIHVVEVTVYETEKYYAKYIAGR